MHCPFCQHNDTRVIDSRVSDDGATIRRRRVCEACGERFSTLETIELKLPLIIKSDGRREAFDARKLRVMAELRKLDHVAYVRFASVYRAFQDVADFREELDRLESDNSGEGQLPLLEGEAEPAPRKKR
jgi:transcriptional repressor NrdR